jgi:adenylate kinase
MLGRRLHEFRVDDRERPSEHDPRATFDGSQLGVGLLAQRHVAAGGFVTASRPVHVALLGKPGAGKGTQGEVLACLLHVPLVSLGEILRRRATGSGPTSRRLAQLMERGEFVPDDIVLEVVRSALDESDDRGYILDGFPRTQAQARADVVPIDAVLNLELPDEDARDRLTRRAADGRTDDADREAIGRRLHQFRTDTAPVVDLYRDRGILTTVDATAPPADVSAAILDALRGDGASSSKVESR